MSNTKIWAISIVALLCGWFLYVSAASLVPVFVAVSVAYFIHPLVLWIQNGFKLKRKIIAVGITLAMILTLLVILFNIILPPLILQMTRFAREFTGYSVRFMELMDILGTSLAELGLDSRITDQLDDMLRQVITLVSNSIMGFVTSAIGYITKFTDIVIVIILLFYFLLDGPDMTDYLVGQAPEKLRKGCENVIAGINSVVWGYMKNQIIISTIHGIGCFLVFLLIRLPFAGLLGTLNGVLNMIPYFGSIIASMISILVALFYLGTREGLLTGLAVFALNMVLGNIITPRLQAKSLGIHPALVIAALLVCNHIWGATGMFIAVPLLGLSHLVAHELREIIRAL